MSIKINKIKVGDIVLYSTPACDTNYGKVARIFKIVDSNIESEPKGSLMFSVEDIFNPRLSYPSDIFQSSIKKIFKETDIELVNIPQGQVETK